MPSIQPIGLLSFGDFNSFDVHRRSRDSYFTYTLAADLDFVRNANNYHLPGYCAVCCKYVQFHVSKALSFVQDEMRIPLWRETLFCPDCGLNNRMRALLHLMSAEVKLTSASQLYFTEQITDTFKVARQAWPNSIGSEYLRDGTPNGECNASSVRFEDMTCLTFASESFDGVITMDVIEHIPDYAMALREAYRVLRPGGQLVLSAPFNLDIETSLVRARIDSAGNVEHLQPPEWHNDPLDPHGLLCFTTLGWDFLQLLSDIGFAKPKMSFYWSARFGYLGVQYCVLCNKP